MPAAHSYGKGIGYSYYSDPSYLYTNIVTSSSTLASPQWVTMNVPPPPPREETAREWLDGEIEKTCRMGRMK